MKKKIFAIFVASLLTMTTIIPVAAQENAPTETEYKISAIDLTLSVTDELNVLTRNVSNGNPALDILDADAVELQNSYLQNHIYLNAFPDNLSYEILITSTDVHNSDAKNFSELSEEDFTDYMATVTAEYEKIESEELISINLYENGTTKYVCTYTHSTLNDVSSYVIKYYTVMNGRNYNYIMQTDDLEIDDTLSFIMQNIVDSAQYTEVESSITESGLFMELYETFIGFGLTVIVLGGILFMLTRTGKKAK